MVIALGIANAKQALDAQRKVSDLTNEMLKKNSETLKKGSIDIAKESERAIVDLETINLDKVEVIGREAFKNCESLQLEKEELLKAYAIGRNAFEGCNSLTELNLTSLRNSGKEIFKNCKNN